jgi:hypothetical protein
MLWALAAGVAAVFDARERPLDPMPELQRQFAGLARYLPGHGVIGYLQAYENAGDEEAVRMHYAAQYTLVPRVVVTRTDTEFLIVARGTERPGGDPRLDGFYRVATVSGGHRLYRRLR